MRRLALLSLLCLCGFSSDYDEDVPPVAARYQWGSSGSAWAVPAEAPAPVLDCRPAADGAFSCTGGTASKQGTPTTVGTPYSQSPYAVRLNGSTDQFDFGDVHDQSGDFTICTFANTSITTGSGNILGKYAGGGLGFLYYRTTNTSNATLVVCKDNANCTFGNGGGMGGAGPFAAACAAYDYVTDGASIIRSNVNGTAPNEITNAVGPPQNVATALKIGQNWTGDIGRVTLWSGWAASASDLARMTSAFQARQGSFNAPLTVTRAAPETIESGGALYSVPSGNLAVGSAGAGVFGSAVNVALYSEAIGQDAATTSFQSPWSGDVGVTVSANNASCPLFNGQRMDLIDNTGGTNIAPVYQNVTVASSTGPFTSSGWVAVTTGTATRTIGATCPSGVAASGCACENLSGGSCSASTVDHRCLANVTATTTPQRVKVSFSCASSITAPVVALWGGNRGTSTGTACYSGLQFETGAVATPYQQTLGSPATRPATVISAVSPYSAADSLISVAVTGTPVGAWGAATRGLLGIGPYGGPNALRFYTHSPSGTVYVGIVDNATVSRTWVSAAHALTAEEVTLTFEYNTRTGVPRVLKNGTPLAMTDLGGAGTGLITTWNSTVYLGSMGTGNQFNGSLKQVVLCRSDAETCWSQAR